MCSTVPNVVIPRALGSGNVLTCHAYLTMFATYSQFKTWQVTNPWNTINKFLLECNSTVENMKTC